MINAGLALQFSEQIEAALGLTPTAEDEKRLRQTLPRVSMVERTER